MNKTIRYCTMLFLTFFTILAFGVHELAFCHSHGGRGGRDRGKGEYRHSSNLARYNGAAVTFVSDLTQEEIDALTAGLSFEVREALLNDMSSWPEGVTVKQFITLIDSGTPVSVLTETDIKELLATLNENTRQFLMQDFSLWTADMSVLELKETLANWNEGDRVRANMNAYFTDMAASSVEFLDWFGEKVQIILAFCPGIGTLPAVSLDILREGANSRKKGNTPSQIAEDAMTKGSISFLFNYFSKADEIFNIAAQGKNIEQVAPAMAAYMFTKHAENETSSTIEKLPKSDENDMTIFANFARDFIYGMPQKSRNKVKKPTPISSSGIMGPMSTMPALEKIE